VGLSTDLDETAVKQALGARPVRAYPALLSTEAEATAWARAGAAAGAVVTADYQVSPRGRAGLPWHAELGRGLGFSVVLRPDLPPEREGWPYVAVSLGVSDMLGEHGRRLQWPDRVATVDGAHAAALGCTVQLGPARTEWVVATVLVEHAAAPRAPLLGALADAVEERMAQPPEVVVAEYRSRCVTLGERVLARMIPMGPAGPQITGTAVDVLSDGALVLLTDREHRVAVRPQNLGLLEPADS
jgi:BirA family biotin operon repressor/biotin-[acetyl-CoA-carboxylase] ligase